ncbi:hypothetical protein MJ575_00580 [Klebsiella pneumoniae]|nr:hypothetical protein MJ575_00580 [Klebsiella pneumoniae]
MKPHTAAHPLLLKRAITDTEIAAVTHARFVFIGREAYEAAGEAWVREDLFSARRRRNGGRGTERLVQEKLAAAARLSNNRKAGHGHWLVGTVRNYGDDRRESIIWCCRRRRNSALRSCGVLMSCAPRRKP